MGFFAANRNRERISITTNIKAIDPAFYAVPGAIADLKYMGRDAGVVFLRRGISMRAVWEIKLETGVFVF